VNDDRGGSGSRVAIIAALAGCGCLIGIVVLGIVAAISIPNFIDAKNKAQQKRTISDMGVYSTALNNFYSTNGTYPAASSIEELSAAVGQPAGDTTTDGWQNPLRYLCQPSAADCRDFRLISPGRDGAFDPTDPFVVSSGPIDDFQYDSDIVLGPDGFLSYPRQ
jgi:type II secretory pathway pseudopilin PulG